MSEQPTEERPHLEVTGDVAFGALMDTLVASEAPEVQGDSGDQPADPDQTGGGAPDPQGGDAGAGGADGAPEADRGDGAAVAGAEPAGREAGGGQRDAPEPAAADTAAGGADAGSAPEPAAAGTGAVDASAVVPELGKLTEAVEKNVTKSLQQTAYNEVREQHERYFEALEKHPRLLVGQQVPSVKGEGMETLRDSADAKEWQEAVKSILVEEINSRVAKQMDESRQYLETVHSSIDLFQKNTDLIPGTRNFDRDLADRFAALAKPYEIRVDGKLQGYSIPVQPLIDGLRASKPAPKAPPPAARPAQSQAQSEPPQAAVTSKAPTSKETEDFSTLFGTIGLPNLKI